MKLLGGTVRARCLPSRPGPRECCGVQMQGVPRRPGDTMGLSPQGGLRNSRGLQGVPAPSSSDFLFPFYILTLPGE